MLVAQIIVYFAAVYLLIGIVFSAYFVTAKIGEFDEAAKGTGFGFRFIIFFGAVPFWSVLFLRSVRGSAALFVQNSHRREAEKSHD